MQSPANLRMEPQFKISRGVWMTALFLLIAAAGLLYVKWWPYYHKALLSADQHSIGSSILGETSLHLESASSVKDALHYSLVYLKAIWKAAALAVVLGSLLQVLIPRRWLLSLFGGANFRSALHGGIAALPGMMCTCCAAPVAAGMRKSRVSAGAAIAFWLGNPLLNPAVLIFMTFVLSWKFTLMRILFGLALTFGVSYLVNRLMRNKEPLHSDIPGFPDASAEAEGSFGLRWLKSLGRLLLQIAPAYLVAVLALGALKEWFFPLQLGDGFAALLVLSLTSALFVIPTAAEIPIIQTFTAAGMGAGPAAVMLMTLPAISLPSMVILYRSFPKRILLVVFGSVGFVGLISGWIGGMFL